MPERNILAVAVDGLRASALGAYGNTTFPTPALDQFAADSFLLDWCYAQSPDLVHIYRGLWYSLQSTRPAVAAHEAPSLPRLLRNTGYATALITDDHELYARTSSDDFVQRIQLPNGFEESRKRAEDIADTGRARLFAAASNVIEQGISGQPRLVWVHSRGMYGPWDAPLELQARMLDKDDPPPVESVARPDFFVGEADDPDAAFRYGCAYAAQVMVLDACWNGLLQSLESAGAAEEWLVMLLGVRGFPLGEHQRIGGVDPRLYGEQLHVPWLVRFPDGRGRLARSSRLVSHLDLLPTLIDWIGISASAEPLTFDGMSFLPLAESIATQWRDALFAVSDASHRAIRTPEWCLRQTAQPSVESAALTRSVPAFASELYVRPDDRWEANDVAKLCPDIVETLTRALNENR